MVVEELRLPRLPVGTRRFLNSDFIEPCTALLNLCLTSRHFYQLAEPLLYESIALTEDRHFVLLFDSLLAKRDRRSWIRSIACPMCLTTETEAIKIVPIWNRLIAPRNDTNLDEPEEQALRIVGLRLDRIPEKDRSISRTGSEGYGCGLHGDQLSFCDQLLAVILCLTTNLEDILLQIPTDQEEYKSFQSLQNLNRVFWEAANNHDFGALQSLRSVRVQPTRYLEWEEERQDLSRQVLRQEILPCNVRPGSWDPGFGVDPLRLYTFEIPTVEEVEFCGDNGIWFKLLDPDGRQWIDFLPQDLKRFRSMKSLKLHESRTTPSYLRYLLEEAHSLETFHYTTRQQEWRQDYWCPQYFEFHFVPRDFFSINEALEPIRSTVKELVLGNVKRPWDNGDEEYRDLELIVGLGAFERLTRLSIDIRWLIPISLDLDEQVAIVPLCKRLPQSIEDIKVTETWTRTDIRALSSSPQLEKRAMAWVQAALWTLFVVDDEGDGKSMKLAHLKRVTLTAVPAFHAHKAREVESNEEDDEDYFQCIPLKTDDGIGEMKTIAARHSVDFKVKWMCDRSLSSPSDGESDSDCESVGSSVSH